MKSEVVVWPPAQKPTAYDAAVLKLAYDRRLALGTPWAIAIAKARELIPRGRTRATLSDCCDNVHGFA
jgi:hypothetical protein